MIFHSLQFVIFFAIVYAIYLSIGHKAQNRFLLIASYVFYGSWDWHFLSLIMLTTVTDFLCARAIYATSDKSLKKRYVAISCVINLGILGVFKYFNFFVDNFVRLFSYFGLDISGPMIDILLPVGISFYTFQSMSYTLDVYRRQVKPTENLLDYALYVSFFPQLVAGPIERAKHLLPQVLTPRMFSAEQIQQGAILIALGVFKKLYIADNLGKIVDPIFALDAQPTGPMVLIGGYAFLFQVYCDFSAYTDIARGTSKLMGFDIMENFRAPYLSRNIQEFWTRWHISLTTWIRDYLYYPLAFMRLRKRSIPPYLVTAITFSIMGLWHGAAWGYVFWGLYNGLVLAAYGSLAKPLKRIHSAWPDNRLFAVVGSVLAVLLTFHFVLIGDLFFRSSTLDQSWYMVSTLFSNFEIGPEFWSSLSLVATYSLPMIAIDAFTVTAPVEERYYRLPAVPKYLLLYGMFAAVSVYGTSTPSFIYFQF